MQTDWYAKKFGACGVPLGTRRGCAGSDWMIFRAGTVSDITIRNSFISRVKAYIANGQNTAPSSDWYYTTTGVSVGFRNRLVAGGHFALLALPK
ncbi:hypothetical protein RhiJN_14952 [Ceratobasidium sp. AG-Ba]|nr:hypothetical protein RhiJN_14952 [Ceratobasidium sp. AG-Ba]